MNIARVDARSAGPIPEPDPSTVLRRTQPRLTYADHVRRTLTLALPVMAARAGLLIMATVDTVMCGWAGADQLAFYGIAMAPQAVLMLIGIGLLLGTVILTAQKDGASESAVCGRIWRLGQLDALLVGLLTAALLWPGASLLLLLGQGVDIAEGGGQVLRALALGMPAILLFIASSGFLEGISRPKPGMVVMIAANLLNVGLNALLMFGPFEMGAVGAALATSITRWFMCLALGLYILTMRSRLAYGVLAPMAGHWHLQLALVRLGWPMALSFLMEHGAFFAAGTFAGWLGTTALASYQVVLNTMSLIYMVAIGIAVATGVRVGNAIGRRDREGMARAGWVGVGIGAVVMLLIMPLLMTGRGLIVTIYTTDPSVVALAGTDLAIAAWLILADATQGILVSALRGAADIWAATIAQLIAFWLVAIPLCYYLSFNAGYGISGLLFGLFFGLVTACLTLGWRFAVLSRRELRPALAQ